MRSYKKYETKKFVNKAIKNLAITLLASCFWLGTGFSEVYAQTKLTYPEILTALSTKFPTKEGVTRAEMLSELKSRILRDKVDKPLTKDREDDLKQAGATFALLELIRTNSPPVPVSPAKTGKLGIGDILVGLTDTKISLAQRNQKLIAEVISRGVSFKLSDAYETMLRSENASESLIEVIREKSGPTIEGEVGITDILKGLAYKETPRRINNNRLISSIKKYGISFELNDEIANLLRDAGANTELIKLVRSLSPTVRNKPLSSLEIVDDLRFDGATKQENNERVLKWVKLFGISFIYGEEHEEILRDAGASSELISAIREASKTDTGTTATNDKPVEPITDPPVTDEPEIFDAGDVKAKSIKKPRYTEEALAANAKGPVYVRVTITKKGTVKEATAEGGHPMLREAAEAAAYAAKFKPIEKDGEPVEASGLLKVKFRGGGSIFNWPGRNKSGDSSGDSNEEGGSGTEEPLGSNDTSDTTGGTNSGTSTNNPPPPPTGPPAARLKADKTSIRIGRRVAISWVTLNAKRVWLYENGRRSSVRSRGRRVMGPSRTTTYRLVAENERGRTSRSITVRVTSNSGSGNSGGNSNAPLRPPVQISPNGRPRVRDHRTSTPTITFRWHSSTGATAYGIQVQYGTAITNSILGRKVSRKTQWSTAAQRTVSRTSFSMRIPRSRDVRWRAWSIRNGNKSRASGWMYFKN